jgi:RecA/RadA recombinase
MVERTRGPRMRRMTIPEPSNQTMPTLPDQLPVNLDQQMKNRQERRRERVEPKSCGFLSTGSSMLNLAMSDSISGGWPIGRINTLPGQSAAGKTVLVLSTFCEACLDSKFDEYELIYDDVERRCDFNMGKLFPPLIDRLVTPSGMLYRDLKDNVDNSGISNTIQDLRNRMMLLKKSGGKFIYIADSLDSFSSDEELDKEMRRALASAKSAEAANKIAGSFNAEKAKILGQIMRMISDVVADTQSIFILTQQLRQKMNPMPGQSPWTTSGGESPYYYSHVRPYLSKAGFIKDKGCKTGVNCKVRMDKNSVTGKLRDVEFDIYYDLGIDDIGSQINFLLDQGHWKSGAWITVPEFDLKENGKDRLIRKIEEMGLERKLRRIVQQVWNSREESLLLNRKSRY